MPTREFADLVSVVAEAIDEVFTSDSLMLSDHDLTADAAPYAPGPVHAFVVDFEKIIWHFPDAPSRLIDDTH